MEISKKKSASKGLLLSLLISATTLFSGSAFASLIITPIDAVINSGGPGFGDIANTIDQSGLTATYTSGVTDFDSYIASNPTHSVVFQGFEWFSSLPNTASVTYDFGVSVAIDALALWNEESSGIGTLDLFSSIDGINFTSLSAGLLPTVNPENVNYSAEVFSFAETTARYVRFDMSNCPNGSGNFAACAIGEVAFRQADNITSASEPASVAFIVAGLLGLGLVRRKTL